MNELRRKRKGKDLCVACGKKKDREGQYCSSCNKIYNALKHKHTLKLREEGRCTNCGQKLDRYGWFCKKCCEYLRNRARVRSAERRANGQCVQCGTKIDIGSYCRRCLDMLADRRRKKKQK